MVVEGPAGTVLAAVGEASDHGVASRALTQSLQSELPAKLQRAAQEKRQLEQKVRNAGASQPPPPPPVGCTSDRRLAAAPSGRGGGGNGALVAAAVGPLAPGSSRQQRPAFGVVYEYRDSVGKPQYVAGTSQMPEMAFAEDYRTHSGVRELFDGPAPGRARVVWAGVGGGHVGEKEMATMRDAVAKERATKQRISELSGAKPYSRHSHMLA